MNPSAYYGLDYSNFSVEADEINEGFNEGAYYSGPYSLIGEEGSAVSCLLTDPYEEAIWIGHSDSTIESYMIHPQYNYKYTSWSAHIDLLTSFLLSREGILSCSLSNIRFFTREGRLLFSQSYPSFRDIRALSWMDYDRRSMVFATYEGSLVQFDSYFCRVHKQVPLLDNISTIVSSAQGVCVAHTNGSITIHDPLSLREEGRIDVGVCATHLDVDGYLLAVCGVYSPVYGQYYPDSNVKIIDLRNMRQLNPISFSSNTQYPSGINWVGFHPTFPSTLSVLTSYSEFCLFDLNSFKLLQSDIPDTNSASSTATFSSTGDYLAIGTSQGTVKIHKSRSRSEKDDCLINLNSLGEMRLIDQKPPPVLEWDTDETLLSLDALLSAKCSGIKGSKRVDEIQLKVSELKISDSPGKVENDFEKDVTSDRNKETNVINDTEGYKDDYSEPFDHGDETISMDNKVGTSNINNAYHLGKTYKIEKENLDIFDSPVVADFSESRNEISLINNNVVNITNEDGNNKIEFISTFPEDTFSPSAPPRIIPPELLKNMRMMGNMGVVNMSDYFPEPPMPVKICQQIHIKKTLLESKNGYIKDQNEHSDCSNELKYTSESSCENNRAPFDYRHFIIANKGGFEGFDFHKFNRTIGFCGLENGLSNSYVNSILQVFYYIPAIRHLALTHLCLNEICLLCQLGFLFNMMDQEAKLDGSKTCLTSNFLRILLQNPGIGPLGLNEDEFPEISFSNRIENFNRFILKQLHEDELYNSVFPKGLNSEKKSNESEALTNNSNVNEFNNAPFSKQDLGFNGKHPNNSDRFSQNLVSNEKNKDKGNYDNAHTGDKECNKDSYVCGFETLGDEGKSTNFSNSKSKPSISVIETLFKVIYQMCNKCLNCLETVIVEGSDFFISLCCSPSLVSDKLVAHSFSSILSYSLSHISSVNPSWCSYCNYVCATEKFYKVVSLSHILCLNCNSKKLNPFWSVISDEYNSRKSSRFRESNWIPFFIRIVFDPNSDSWIVYELSKSNLEKFNDFYELFAVVSQISEPDKQHLVSQIYIPEEYYKIVCEKKLNQPNYRHWHLFNDFHVLPISQYDAVHINKGYKRPSLLYYAKSSSLNKLVSDKEIVSFIEKVGKQINATDNSKSMFFNSNQGNTVPSILKADENIYMDANNPHFYQENLNRYNGYSLYGSNDSEAYNVSNDYSSELQIHDSRFYNLDLNFYDRNLHNPNSNSVLYNSNRNYFDNSSFYELSKDHGKSYVDTNRVVRSREFFFSSNDFEKNILRDLKPEVFDNYYYSHIPQKCPFTIDILNKLDKIVGIDTEFVLGRREEGEEKEGKRNIIRAAEFILARVSVVSMNNQNEISVIMNDYVSTPGFLVKDYLTQYSGIYPGDLNHETSSHSVLPLKYVYLKILYLISKGFLFVGHGLRTDFRIINIVVPPNQIIDTVELFHLENQRKISLRFLAQVLLGINIQEEVHDSIEDSKTALLLYKEYLKYTNSGKFEEVLQKVYKIGRITKWRIEKGEDGRKILEEV